ncbi:MAG: isoaspartyl peptidase/L-asparaginase [Bacteroidetes bacterium]|nr:MAG: isoaspartyl peptidase/L-asparaginase [Bacteroidota bacterium]
MKNYFSAYSCVKTIFVLVIIISFNLNAQNSPFGIVVHGGAGTILKSNMTPELEQQYSEKLTEAITAGYEILKNSGTSLDAAEKVINILEDSPLFNAGKGAVFTNAGTNELDAAIMDGKTLKAGAVGGVKHIKNPISLARMVMEQSKHVLLTGDGAETFAKENGMELVPAEYFRTERRWKQLQDAKAKEDSLKQKKGALPLNDEQKYGTVGCVALDKSGNLAAATSTGGTTNKRWGRVGDTPIIGAGTYANNSTCAVSATGTGEFFIRAVVAHDISALMEYKGMSVQQAADEVVMNKLPKINGDGGVIAIDNKGNIAMPFNTSGMYRAYIDNDGNVVVKIYKE